jgi:hypothetical protein
MAVQAFQNASGLLLLMAVIVVLVLLPPISLLVGTAYRDRAVVENFPQGMRMTSVD